MPIKSYVRRYWKVWYVVTAIALGIWLKPSTFDDYVGILIAPALLGALLMMVLLTLFYLSFVIMFIHAVLGVVLEWLEKAWSKLLD